MKKLFLLALLLTFTISKLSSQESIIGKVFKSKIDIPVEDFDLTNIDSIDSDPVDYDKVFEANILFKVIFEKNEKVVIQPLNYPNKNSNRAKKYNDKYFLTTKENFNNTAISARDLISVGVLTIPFKARPKGDNRDFSFSPEFNLSTTLGVRLNPNWNSETNFYFQFGTGVATVGLDSSNSTIDDAQTIASLTILSGLMMDFKGIQIGAYIGWDSISNNSNYNWEYQSKPWFSLGIGFGIFQFGENTGN